MRYTIRKTGKYDYHTVRDDSGALVAVDHYRIYDSVNGSFFGQKRNYTKQEAIEKRDELNEAWASREAQLQEFKSKREAQEAEEAARVAALTDVQREYEKLLADIAQLEGAHKYRRVDVIKNIGLLADTLKIYAGNLEEIAVSMKDKDELSAVQGAMGVMRQTQYLQQALRLDDIFTAANEAEAYRNSIVGYKGKALRLLRAHPDELAAFSELSESDLAEVEVD